MIMCVSSDEYLIIKTLCHLSPKDVPFLFFLISRKALFESDLDKVYQQHENKLLIGYEHVFH